MHQLTQTEQPQQFIHSVMQGVKTNGLPFSRILYPVFGNLIFKIPGKDFLFFSTIFFNGLKVCFVQNLISVFKLSKIIRPRFK